MSERQKWSMMKWFGGWVATIGCGAGLVLPSEVGHAATQSMRRTVIEENGQPLSAPAAFTYQKTTYMPLFYVEQLLKAMHIQNTWTGSSWQIQAPFTVQPLPTLNKKTGPLRIEINGRTLVGDVPKQVAVDPSSGKPTTFIPIWYIQQVLSALELHSQWNGTVWNVQANYTVYTKTGERVAQFYTLAQAQAAVAEYPGGTIQNRAGQTVYTESSFINVDLGQPAPNNVTA